MTITRTTSPLQSNVAGWAGNQSSQPVQTAAFQQPVFLGGSGSNFPELPRHLIGLGLYTMRHLHDLIESVMNDLEGAEEADVPYDLPSRPQLTPPSGGTSDPL